MTTINMVGNGLTGSTGSGAFVGATSPALSSPTSNNFINGYSTTATAAGTTVLTATSNKLQFFTGSTTQTVTLPVTSTLVLGQQFNIYNNSSGVVTVQSSGGNTIQALAANTNLIVTCILTSGTSAASWAFDYSTSTGEGTVTSVAMSVPSLLSISGSPITTSGTLAVTYSGTALPVANGGTNATSAGIAAFNNITGYSAAGSTGTTSTNLVFSTSPTLVTPTLGAASITTEQFNSAPSSSTVSGEIFSATAGENLVFGDIVYIKSDGKLWKADADAAGLFPAQFMSTATISANASGLFLRDGFATLSSWTWTVGAPIYLSTTAGGMTQTAPTATDSCTQVLAYAMSATVISFRASPDYITHT